MVLYMEVRQSNAIEKLRMYYTVRANKAGKGGKGEGGGVWAGALVQCKT